MKSQLKLKSKFSDKTKTITKEKTKPITKTKLPLEINLDQIMNPNPAIRAAYNSIPGANDYFYWQDKADWNNEKRIFAYAAVESPGQLKRKINHKIVSLYRKKHNGKDYVFGLEHLSTRDLLGNFVDTTREIGRFSLPHLNATQQVPISK